MNFRRSIGVSIATMAIAAASVVACSADRDEPSEAVSTAASPIVQQAGVMRFRAQTTGAVTRVALLDEGGNGVGTLELTSEAPHRVHAKQTVFGRSFDATWSDEGLTFARDGKASLTVRAGETRTTEAEVALLEATSDLSVALGVARDVGAFSLVTNDTAPRLKPLTFGTGEDERDRFTGSNWAWGTSTSAWQQAYYGSQNAAYNGCAALNSQGCATFQGATMNTSCSTGGYYTSCSTTITLAACAATSSCPH